MSFRSTYLAFILILIISLACGKGSPMSPDLAVNASSEPNPAQSSTGNFKAASFGVIQFDTASGTAEIIPARTSQLHVNATWLLEGPLCGSCLEIDNISQPANNEWHFDVIVRHPGKSSNLRVTAFDVRAIIMLNHNNAFPGLGLTWPDPETPGSAMLNPDGYTTDFNPTDFQGDDPLSNFYKGEFASNIVPDSLLNPYKDFVLPTPRRYLAPGDETYTTIDLRLMETNPVVAYAIEASWALPTVDPPDVLPDDFPLSANISEPYAVVCSEVKNTLYYQDSTSSGGDLDIRLKVYDWQSALPESVGGTIKETKFEAPQWFIDPMAEPESYELAYDPLPYVLYNFHFDVPPPFSGTIPLLIGVVDKEPGLQDIGFATSYDVMYINVSDNPVNQDPVADASLINPFSGPAPLAVQLDPSASYDPDGSIVLYQWDVDDDGAYEMSSTTPNPVGWVFDQPGHYLIHLKVTDNLGATNINYTSVHVGQPLNQPPVADLSLTNPTSGFAPLNVLMDPSLSYDPDGEIVLWEWDTDDDGIYELSLPVLAALYHLYLNPGDTILRLRVTDNDGLMGTDEVLIHVE